MCWLLPPLTEWACDGECFVNDDAYGKTLVNLAGSDEDKRVEYTITVRNKATNSAVWEDVILSDYPDYTYKFTRVLLTSLDTNLQQNVLQAVGVQDGDAAPA